MAPIKITLQWTRETKNTHRYDETGPVSEHTVRQVYLPKRVTGPVPPSAVTVTVEADD